MIVESIQYDDGRTENRGTDATVTGNNIVAKACDEAIANSRIADIIERTGGASKGGDGTLAGRGRRATKSWAHRKNWFSIRSVRRVEASSWT